MAKFSDMSWSLSLAVLSHMVQCLWSGFPDALLPFEPLVVFTHVLYGPVRAICCSFSHDPVPCDRIAIFLTCFTRSREISYSFSAAVIPGLLFISHALVPVEPAASYVC